MRFFKLFSISACVLFVLPIYAQTTKHALIIAAGNYPEANGWSSISSIRDVSIINATLLKQGFKPGNIKTLKDREVTPGGIDSALAILKTKVRAGDVVLIHVSSHGEQIADDNGDEVDKLDETIVTFNAVSPHINKEANRGQLKVGKVEISLEKFNIIQKEYYRDDRFGAAINQLRAKLGKNGDVLVFMDLCHSGTGLRGIAKVRGGQPALVPVGFDYKNLLTVDGSNYVDKTAINEKSLAAYVVISASRADELNKEAIDETGEGIGSLSYAVSRVFPKLDSSSKITYRGLFSEIAAVMRDQVPDQHPMLEGNGIDNLLFSGKLVAQKRFFQINEINDNQIILDAGLVEGLDVDALIAVYPSGTTDIANKIPLAIGKIIKSTPFSSIASLSQSLSIEQPSLGWVFITKPVYNINPIVLNIPEAAEGSEMSGYLKTEILTLKKDLQHLPIITFSGIPELILAKSANFDSIKTRSGFVYATVPNNSKNNQKLVETIDGYIRYKFLNAFQMRDPSIEIDVKLVPFKDNKPDLRYTSLIKSEFTEGDTVLLWVKNSSKANLYVNVLDIQPDGKINKIIPNKEKNIDAGDLLIKKEQTHLFENYKIVLGPPYGSEIFKIFASRRLIDVEHLATQEVLSRGGGLALPEEGSTFNILFSIAPKSNK